MSTKEESERQMKQIMRELGGSSSPQREEHQSRTATITMTVPSDVSNGRSFHRWFTSSIISWAKTGLMPDYDVLAITENMETIWERKI